MAHRSYFTPTRKIAQAILQSVPADARRLAPLNADDGQPEASVPSCAAGNLQHTLDYL